MIKLILSITVVVFCVLESGGLVSAQFDAKKCRNYLDCPSTLCCGWATPQKEGFGERHKICYRPTEEVYMNFNGYVFDFMCDPPETDPDFGFPNDKDSQKLDDLNANKTKYEERFWYNFQPNDPLNIPGYGRRNPFVPPLQAPNSILSVYDRYMLISSSGLSPVIKGLQNWLSGIPNGDTKDGYTYSTAEAAGS